MVFRYWIAGLLVQRLRTITQTVSIELQQQRRCNQEIQRSIKLETFLFSFSDSHHWLFTGIVAILPWKIYRGTAAHFGDVITYYYETPWVLPLKKNKKLNKLLIS